MNKEFNESHFHYVLVNSKPDHPPGIRTFSLPRGSGFYPALFGLGFELEIFYSFERKMQELLDLFQRNRRQLLFHVNFCKNSKCLLYLE